MPIFVGRSATSASAWNFGVRYIERESAADQEISKELDQEISKELDQEISKELDLENISELETTNTEGKKYDRYADEFATRHASRFPGIRQSYARTVGEVSQAKSFSDLRSVSSVNVDSLKRRSEVLLSHNASDQLVERRADKFSEMRRGSSSELRAHGSNGRVKKGQLGFGSGGDSVDISGTLDTWQKSGDPRIFKVILSPEFGDKTDLKVLTTEFVSAMERDLNSKLQWVAVEHHNTDNPHVHLVVRGIDDRGEELEISPEYIKEGSRQRAGEAATRQLGYRTDKDIAESLERQIIQQRYTDLDRQLVKKAKNLTVDFNDKIPAKEKLKEQRLKQIRRLVQLEKMGLAEKVGNKIWKLNPELESALRQMQIAGDKLKTKFQHREMISDPNAQLVNTSLKEVGDRVVGKLVGTGLNDKNQKPYMMIEGVDGQIHYLNQSAKIQQMRGAGELKVGDYISLEVVERKEKGEIKGKFVKTKNYGKNITPELIDKEIFKKRVVTPKIKNTTTVLGQFLEASAIRLEALEKAGAVSIENGKVIDGSAIAYDRVRFKDSGLNVESFDGQPSIIRVNKKGNASIAFSMDGSDKIIQLTDFQLKEMRLDRKFISNDSIIFIGRDYKKQLSASVVKLDKLDLMVDDDKINRLDNIANQISNISDNSIKSAIIKRMDIWSARGVDFNSPDFSKKAAIWNANNELAKSEGLNNLISDSKRNKLDYLIGKEDEPINKPLKRAIQERILIWESRGVSYGAEDFKLKMNVWNKGVEFADLAKEKGVNVALEQISKDKNKPVRELDCQAGFQVTGRVVFVAKSGNESSIVIDSGRDLTVIKQNVESSSVDVRPGQLVRAKAEPGYDPVKRRVMMWRFADLEREQAKQVGKGKERGFF
jgi:type IV secretory pathway VirD2 relaxase